LIDFWKSGKVSLTVSLKRLTHPEDGARGDGYAFKNHSGEKAQIKKPNPAEPEPKRYIAVWMNSPLTPFSKETVS
jgi:hypothetical protein